MSDGRPDNDDRPRFRRWLARRGQVTGSNRDIASAWNAAKFCPRGDRHDSPAPKSTVLRPLGKLLISTITWPRTLRTWPLSLRVCCAPESAPLLAGFCGQPDNVGQPANVSAWRVNLAKEKKIPFFPKRHIVLTSRLFTVCFALPILEKRSYDLVITSELAWPPAARVSSTGLRLQRGLLPSGNLFGACAVPRVASVCAGLVRTGERS